MRCRENLFNDAGFPGLHGRATAVYRTGLRVGNRSYLRREQKVIFDILVALVITAIAIVLGVTVHPVLLFIVVLAIVYLVVRSRGRSRL